MEHLQKNHILTDQQHGFRHGFSCQTQLVALVEDLLHNMDNRCQIDLIFLDFAKAFDRVPHQRLLSKLSTYGIAGNILQWIRAWLTQRSQQVVLDGSCSASAPVKSGVPQGTVMGPIMFLIYINDIVDNISSPIRLFADDCLLYRVIQSETDTADLQSDLDTLAHWSHIWQMEFNISKCIVINCTRAHTVISNTYVLQGQTLQSKLDHPYLGLTISNTMQWSHHITNISNKASKVLNFLRRNL